MKEFYRQQLDLATSELANIDPDHELRTMLNKCLTPDQISSIYNEYINTTPAKRVMAMINYLKCSSDAAYLEFRKCIRKIRPDLLETILPQFEEMAASLDEEVSVHGMKISSCGTEFTLHPFSLPGIQGQIANHMIDHDFPVNMDGSGTYSSVEDTAAVVRDTPAESIMTEEHKEKLLRNRKHIVENISIDQIMNDLQASSTFKYREVQEIRAKTGEHQQAELFLDILYKKPDSSYFKFISALKASDQEHVANLLEAPNRESLFRGVPNQRLPKPKRENFTASMNKSLEYESVARPDESRALKRGITINSLPSAEESNQMLGVGVSKNTNGMYLHLNFEIFLKQTSLVHNPEIELINGVTVMQHQVFIVAADTAIVDIYDSFSFKRIDQHRIEGAARLKDIVACAHNRCLYISDTVKKVIYRLNHQLGTSSTPWPTHAACEGLSLTRSHNLLATFANALHEYSPNGKLIQEIRLNSSHGIAEHCVKLSNDQFVVSLKGGKHGRICIIDGNGIVIKSNCASPGSQKIGGPCYLLVDKHDKVMVADYCNSRVVLFNSDLVQLGSVLIPEDNLKGPVALAMDEVNKHLYIGEYGASGRLFVLKV